MKFLLVGLDGGDERILRRMPMPFVHSLLDDNVRQHLEEDLWSRGWAKIMSGAANENLGAFYTKPVLGKEGYWFAQGFSSERYLGNPAVTTLWDQARANGLRIGVMNFPTTAPVPPEIEGFMVTGAGGGISQKGVGSAPAKACYPAGVKEILDEAGYIFDVRFKKSGIRNLPELIETLKLMHTRRIDGFIRLAKEYKIDAGALAFVSMKCMQYLDMYDLWRMIHEEDYRTPATELLEGLYASFDGELKRLFEVLQPENFILTSDHGQSRRLGTVNLSVFLEEKGLLRRPAKPVELARKVVNRFYKTIYGWPISKDSTAFTARYISGIYINDAKRFGGSIPEAEINRRADEIISAFNEYGPAQRQGMTARPFRRLQDASQPYYDELPDVWVDAPEELFFENSGPFFAPNPDYGPLPEDLTNVTRDQWTGAKGRKPLFFHSPGLAPFVPEKQKLDLRAVNATAVGYFKSLNTVEA